MQELERAAGGATRQTRQPGEAAGEETRVEADRRGAAEPAATPQAIDLPEASGALAQHATIELEREQERSEELAPYHTLQLPPPEIHPTIQLEPEREPAEHITAQPTIQLERLPAQMDEAAPRAAESRQSVAKLPYLAGIDGLRAIAVIAVLIFHADLGLRGGFLGVESFFVLSGFLITSLLLAEWRAQGRVRLGYFWLRRARRLLPALFLLLGVTAALAALLPRASTRGLGGDILAALAYIMNWHLIAGGQSYFDPMARPPLLQHLWSLAVEEQFYLLWPVLFVVGMRLLRRRGLLAATLALTGLSIGLMATLYQPGSDPSRIYYGTDTRASGLLIGSALALVWAPGQPPGTRWVAERRRAGPLLELLGALAVCALVASFVLLHARHPLLYRGGFVVVALATAVAVAAVSHPRTRLLARGRLCAGSGCAPTASTSGTGRSLCSRGRASTCRSRAPRCSRCAWGSRWSSRRSPTASSSCPCARAGSR
jgi:peptidoglycan/LPS O-acetylase OafA/YrhL